MPTSLSRTIIEKIRREAKAHFRGARASHGWDHTERVLALALHIGKREGADRRLLSIAALLHDIGRRREDESLGTICHAKEGARMARRILARHGIAGEVIDRIAHCIEHHRFRGKSAPDTVEARALFDADKLDAIGAVGVGRAFLFAGEAGAKLHNARGTDVKRTRAYGPEDTAYREFLVKLKDVHRRMLTREGRRLARARHAFMVRFFRQLNEETRGIR